MKAQRQRERANPSSSRAIDPATAAIGDGSDIASSLGDVEGDELFEPTDAQAALSAGGSDYPTQNGNGSGNGHTAYGNEATNGNGNGHAFGSDQGYDDERLVLARRKRRVTTVPKKQAQGPVVASQEIGVAEPAPSAPPVSGMNGNGHSNGKGATQSNGVALPPKAQRKSSSVASTTVIAPISAPPAAPTKAPARAAQPVQTAAVIAPVASVAQVVAAEPRRTVWQWRPDVSIEMLIWIGFLALAFATRFWDLGNRGIHHDESLHSTYSYYLYNGTGYVHDPMMHGPLQFHLIAGMYWLFSPNDATARFASALCGVWVVISPFFLRRQLGRVTALIASFLLLVSPGILYFSRMAREDSIYSAMEMIFIVGLLRFISTRRPADFFILCAGLALMSTIKETTYLTMAVLGSLLILMFVVQAGYAIVGALVGYGAAMGAWLVYVNMGMKNGSIGPLPNIPDQSPNYQTIANFAQSFIMHPLVLGAAVITVLFVAALIVLFRMQRNRMLATTGGSTGSTVETVYAPARVGRVLTNGDATAALQTRPSRTAITSTNGAAVSPVVSSSIDIDGATTYTTEAVDVEGDDEASEVWDPRRLDPTPGSLLSHYEPGSLPHLVGSLFSRPAVLVIGALIMATIFTVFYTVFFTDVPRGIASGMFASLGYWMAQQGVARGGQPWYYYLLLVPLYEPISVFFSIVGTIFFSYKGVRWFFRRRAAQREVEGASRLGAFNTDRPVPFARFSAFLAIFMIWWIAGVWFIYSWAGEKMPWLMMHIARPSALLSAMVLGALVTSIIARRSARIAAATALLPADTVAVPLYTLEEPIAVNGRSARPSNIPAPPRSSNRRTAAPVTSAAARTSTRRAGVAPAFRAQEPFWITWNRPGSLFPGLSFLALFVLFAFSYALTMNHELSTDKTSSNWTTWGVTWVWPVLMLATVVAYSVWVGPGRALRYTAVGIFAVFFVYQFRSATQLAYFQPDVATEMAVYVQTSPDVTRTMQELDAFSELTTGGKNIKIEYDDTASWPFSWYLHDYKSAQFIGSNQPTPQQDVPVAIVDYARNSNDPAMLKDYVAQRYAMRWWFPEEWYKNDLMSTLPAGETYTTASLTTSAGVLTSKLGDTFTKPDNQATLWNYLMFRVPPKSLGSTDMMVFVRKDVAQMYHMLQYQPLNVSDVPTTDTTSTQPLEQPRPVPDGEQQ